MTITVTMRTLDLIDEAYGFDFYILKVRPCTRQGWRDSLCSSLGAAGLPPRCTPSGACS